MAKYTVQQNKFDAAIREILDGTGRITPPSMNITPREPKRPADPSTGFTRRQRQSNTPVAQSYRAATRRPMRTKGR
ncbi:hypothetical protein [Nocardia sp. NPDC052566]|uniref:hypothetical protein n=1 Tax=Nocardia sp. NPDC052566 TaxID=3364330 RepID=UPI0037CABEF0